MTAEQAEQIKSALVQAQAHTTGTIAVRIVNDENLDAFERAKTEFLQKGLHKSTARNTALVLVAPKARRFAVIGDAALHERVGDPFWTSLVDEMKPYFLRDAIADGIIHAITALGSALRTHFHSEKPS